MFQRGRFLGCCTKRKVCRLGRDRFIILDRGIHRVDGLMTVLQAASVTPGPIVNIHTLTGDKATLGYT